MDIIDKESNLNKRLTSEMLHIKSNDSCLNEQKDTEKLNYAYDSILDWTIKNRTKNNTNQTHRMILIHVGWYYGRGLVQLVCSGLPHGSVVTRTKSYRLSVGM